MELERSLLSGWIRCTDMLTGRRNHFSAVDDTTLYVLCGMDDFKNTTLSSVEEYNTLTNKRSSAGHLVHAVYYAACVSCKNFIYLIDGVGKDNNCVFHVQVCNPAQETLLTDGSTYASCTRLNESCVVGDVCKTVGWLHLFYIQFRDTYLARERTVQDWCRPYICLPQNLTTPPSISLVVALSMKSNTPNKPGHVQMR